MLVTSRLWTVRTPRLRAWQERALDAYVQAQPRDFLAVATPGAGKTTFALVVAARLLADRVVDRVVVVTPTDHLKSQWASAADGFDMELSPDFGRGTGMATGALGPVVTYAGVAAATAALRAFVSNGRTLVILDEIHHAADALSWGEAVQEAFGPAARRLSLTGTPFRSDINPIPFVTYQRDSDGVLRSQADFSYGYAPALADGAVRPVLFLAYSGEMTWRTRAGDLVSAELSAQQARDVTAGAWRTALDPRGTWITRVLKDADRRLGEVRRHIPDAAGLVIASDQTAARAYAARLTELTGQRPVLVVSDDPGASTKIEAFAASSERWLVAVRMVSEGVDIPRLMVGVYATSAATPLYFAQAVGRFVRARQPGETASIFLPSVQRLLAQAAELEDERDHVLVPKDSEEGTVVDPLGATERELAGGVEAPDALTLFEPIASEATLDRVVFDGGVFDGRLLPMDAAEEDFLGIPGLLAPEDVTALLHSRRSEDAKSGAAAGNRHGSAAAASPTARADRAALRAELNDCVRAYARQQGLTPAAVHAEARRATGGPAVKQADPRTLQARIDYLRRRAVGK